MPISVPLNDLGRWSRRHAAEVAEITARIMQRGWFLMGPELDAFERAFAAYCGTTDCVGVGNGTDALELALRALDCGPGDEVLTVANAGMYAAAAAVAVGARPRWVDVDPTTMTMCPEALSRQIGRRARVVVVTHLYGRLADVAALAAVAEAHGLALVEDCAQAHGAERDGARAGARGALGCFSFYPTKNLGALGDAGAVVTCDRKLAERLRQLRQYGWSERYDAAIPGGRNSRLDELQAAILAFRLGELDAANARRRDIVRAYRAAVDGLAILPEADGPDHVAHLCVARVRSRDAVAKRLGEAGVRTAIHYPVPDHRQRAMIRFAEDQAPLPVTERITDEVLTLPCFPEMSEDEVAHVSRALGAALTELRP